MGNTSFEKRQLVVYHHAKGKSVREIMSLLQMSRATVYRIIQRFNDEDRIDFKIPPGRPSKVSAQDERFIVRSIAKNPKVSASQIASDLSATRESSISDRTVRRILNKKGYKSCTARRKPYISAANQEKRCEFAAKYIHAPENFWTNVIFSDESKFTVFASDGHQKVWRKPNTALQPNHLNVTVKHGGGKVLVWGCFSASGVGSLVFIDGIMTAESYIAILQKHLHSSAEKMGIQQKFLFYHDNDPKHKAFKTREWLLYNCPRVLATPPQSPDCNPIEHVWDYLERQVRKTPITSHTHLKQRLEEEWAKIPLSYLQNLVASMPRRLKAVLEAQGLQTKY